MSEDKFDNFFSKKVAIMMATFNGAPYLPQQIASLKSQTIPNIDLWVSDDGSSDATMRILGDEVLVWDKGSAKILHGPQRGFVENFRSLITNPRIESDFFAFCDQDDIWDPDKLSGAINWLMSQPEDIPALYCTRTRTISEVGNFIGYSKLFRKKPSFKNAIVQSIAGANTMVMNRAAREIVAQASIRTSFVSHDWWCYLLVSGAGGRVCYSPDAKIGYRQHACNLVGENRSVRARIDRIVRLFRGGYRDWISHNIDSLSKCQDLLSAEAVDTINSLRDCRGASLTHRVKNFFRSGIYRQAYIDQLVLFFACIFRRI